MKRVRKKSKESKDYANKDEEEQQQQQQKEEGKISLSPGVFWGWQGVRGRKLARLTKQSFQPRRTRCHLKMLASWIKLLHVKGLDASFVWAWKACDDKLTTSRIINALAHRFPPPWLSPIVRRCTFTCVVNVGNITLTVLLRVLCYDAAERDYVNYYAYAGLLPKPAVHQIKIFSSICYFFQKQTLRMCQSFPRCFF